jgi:signal transduction histidine kinase
MSHSGNSRSANSLNGELTLGTPAAIFAPRNVSDARSEEIAVISHELRNSLAVVRGAARLLRSPGAGRAIDVASSLIERHVGQMSRHIEDLLEPLRRGRRGLQLTHLDLCVIARYACAAIAPEIARRGHHLAVTLPDQPIWAHADGARLEQVFSNLLVNAAKYTPDGGDISLTLERDHEWVRLRVRDSGVGIEPAMLPRVFGMFVQADSALPRAEGGRGIGLAVVRNLVELHGGTVTATSGGLGRGSEFTIILPTLWAGPLGGLVTP